jgi:hypothetical protein
MTMLLRKTLHSHPDFELNNSNPLFKGTIKELLYFLSSTDIDIGIINRHSLKDLHSSLHPP